MGIITEEMFKNLGYANSAISGTCMLKSCSVALTKRGDEYIVGDLMSGVSVQFKSWGDSSAFKSLRDMTLVGQIVDFVGTIGEFNGQKYITVSSIKATENPEATIDMFMENKYNIDAYWNGLRTQFEFNVSEKAKKIASATLFDNEAVSARFKVEQAASSHHDNCKGGLLAHTYKVMRVMDFILGDYHYLWANLDGTPNQEMKDLLKLGVLFHDIGKIKEMRFGVYQPESCVTHRYLGIEMLPKDTIIAEYSEEFWLQLVSVMLQHHGEFGDDCRTLAAYLVHKCDLLESQMTSVGQALNDAVSSPAGDRIKVDGSWLSV